MEALMVLPDGILASGVINDIAVYSFRTIFFLSAILLMAIVLMQEGKGGGLASALGGQGAETFGVSTGGVNKVTLFLAGLFLFSALGHAVSFARPVMAGEKNAKKPAPVDIKEVEPPKDPLKVPSQDGPKDPPKDGGK